MNYRDARLCKAEGLRERPVPEWSACIVYSPRSAKLFKLNASAWLVFELCETRDYDAVEAEFLEALAPRVGREEALAQLRSCLAMLRRAGLVELKPTPRGERRGGEEGRR